MGIIRQAFAGSARDKAVQEAATGDPNRAIAMAIVYLADVMRGEVANAD